MAADRKPLAGDADAALAADIRAEEVKWLWQDRIPKGMLSVIAGKPDQGKGLFMAHLAATISNRGGRVLYSASEDDPAYITRPRLEAAGANLENIIIWDFVLPQDQEELDARVLDQEIDLVVIDPFADHLAGVSKRSDAVRKVTRPLDDLARKSGAAIVIVEHAVKKVPKNAHPLNCIGGSSSGLPAACRAGFVFGVDPDDADRRLLCVVKLNINEHPKAVEFELDVDEIALESGKQIDVPALLMTGETEYDAIKLVTSEGEKGKVGRKPEKRAAAAEWLTQYLVAAGQPVLATDVKEDAKQRGIAKNTLKRAVSDLDIVKTGGGPKTFWDLPVEIKQALGISAKQEGSSDE